MAIDPSISLGVRPPQIAPLQLQTPLDRYQRMLTLRHLMTQQQTGALNLEQTRLENEALREKAVQFREQTARAAQFRQRASQLQPGESIAPGEAYGLLEPNAAGDLLRNQAQQELSQNNLAIQQLEKLQAAAAASTDQASLTRNVMQLINAKVLPWQMGRDILKEPYDAKAIQEFGMAALNKKDQLLAENARLEREYQATVRPYQLRSAAAGAQTAEQTAAGTTPISPQQKEQAKAQLWASPGGLLTIINDPNSPSADVARAKSQLAGHQELAAIEAGARQNVLATPAKIAQDEYIARRKADLDIEIEKRKADILGAKPMSAEAAVKKALVDTLVVEGKRLQALIRTGGRGAIAGILTGLDTDISRKADNFADLLGRLRSQGAVSLPEEARFRGMIARWADLRTGNMQPAIDALDSIMAEANRVSAGINPKGGTTPPPNAPPIGTVEDGYRFQGGDPSKPENWKKVQ